MGSRLGCASTSPWPGESQSGRTNLCKKIETAIATCAPLVEYRTAAGNKAYRVIRGVMQVHADGIGSSGASCRPNARRRYPGVQVFVCAYGTVALHVPNGVKGRPGHADASLTATLTDCFEVPAADASANPLRRK